MTVCLLLTGVVPDGAAQVSGTGTAAGMITASPRPPSQGVEHLLTQVSKARREIVAVLPSVLREDVAVALKAAARRGTRVFLIVEGSKARAGGYLLTVSHGPPSIYTYMVGRITTPWIMVDGSWVASGPGLDSYADVRVTVIENPASLQQLTTWAGEVTREGPVPRIQVLKRYFGK